MRWIVGGKAAHGNAASPSQMGRFETRWLTVEKNLSALADLCGRWIDIVHSRRPPRGVVLDMDSSVSPTHGEQEMSVWNGHYACNLPDGRGRHPTANVPGDFAADRGTATAATTSAGVRRLMVMPSRATDGRSAFQCRGKWPDQPLDHRLG
jgi:hypothetical protein